MTVLLDKLQDRSARIAVLGQGYVGLPLTVSLAEVGFSTVGLEVNERVANQLRTGKSHVEDIPDSALASVIEANRYTATTSFDEIANCDVAIICVPTPLSKTRDPDVSFIMAAKTEVNL